MLADNSIKYTGISFPFRLNSKGGVALSTTSTNEVPHIVESIRQILGTRRMERCMEYHIFSDLDALVFENNDASSRTLLKYQIEQALQKHEKRIEVRDLEVFSQDNILYAQLIFYVPRLGRNYETTVKVGELING